MRALRECRHPAPRSELKLDSKPIPVKDIWSHDRRARQRLASFGINVAIIALIAFPFWRSVHIAPKQDQIILMPTIFYPGPSLPKMRHLAGGGSPVQLPTPPELLPLAAQAQPVVQPVELMPATAQANVSLLPVGNPGPIAGPPGSNGGHSDAGPGADPTGGGDCVSGPCLPGGDISEPIPIYEPQPEYPDAARRAKFQGSVVVAVIIGTDGHVYQPKVIQRLGLGLDQKALEAVSLWRFEPALRHGHPVRVLADIQVNFRLY